MVQCMIRLQNHGKKNHPYWWIVIQGKNKCIKGRIIERIGLWIPRRTKTVDRSIVINKKRASYWLACGATPTSKVHYFLSLINLLPRKPIPFGTKTLYERPERTYPMEIYHRQRRWGLDTPSIADNMFDNKVNEIQNIVKNGMETNEEAMSQIYAKNRQPNTVIDTDCDTDNINSDDEDFFSRKRNFEVLSKKLNKYLDTKMKLYKGNDLQYNTYVRKIEKLTKGANLDIEGFRDFMKNINKLNDSKSENMKKITTRLLEDFKQNEKQFKNFNSLVNNSEFSYNEILKDDVKEFNDCITSRFNKKIKKLFVIKNEEDLQKASLIELNLLLQIQKIKSIRNQFMSTNIVDSLTSNKEQNQIYESFIKETDNKIYDYEELTKGSPEVLEVFRRHENKSYEDNLFYELNKQILKNDCISKNETLFSCDFNGNKLKENEIERNIYLINSKILEEEIEKSIKKNSASFEPNKEYQETKSTKLSKHIEETKTKKAETNEKILQALEKKENLQEDIKLIYDDVEITKLLEETENILKNNVDQLSTEDILGPTHDYIDTSRVMGQKTKKQLEHEKINEELTKEEGEYRALFTKILDEYKKNKSNKVAEGKLAEAKEIDPKEKEIRTFIEKIDNGAFLNKDYTKDEYEIEREMALKKFELVLRQKKLLKRLRKKHLNHVPGRPKDDYRPHLKEKHGKKYIEKPPVDADEIFKERLDIARGLKEIQIYENEKLKKRVPDNVKEDMKARLKERFGTFKLALYPDGFRHLEDVNTYIRVFPDRNMNDYMAEIHSLCDYETFQKLYFGQFEQIKKIALLGLEFEEVDHLFEKYHTYLKFLNPKNSSQLQKMFKDILQNFNSKGVKLTKFEMIEYMSVFTREFNGNDYVKSVHKTFGVDLDLSDSYSNDYYVPSKFNNHIPFPDLINNNEIKLNKLSPFMPINPIKASPFVFPHILKKRVDFPDRYKKRFNMHGKRFSTLIRPTNMTGSSLTWGGVTSYL